MSNDFQRTGRDLLVELEAHQRRHKRLWLAYNAASERVSACNAEDEAPCLQLCHLHRVLSQLGKLHDHIKREDTVRAAFLNRLEDFSRQYDFEQNSALLAGIRALRQNSSIS